MLTQQSNLLDSNTKTGERGASQNRANTRSDWESIALNLPHDIELAVIDRQTKQVPETPNERALDVIAKKLATQGFRVRLRMPRSGKPYLMIGDEITATLKWEIDPYDEDEQPSTYTEQEYYFDEVCLEISVCGIKVESTLCMANFLAKLKEIKTLNA